MQFNQDLLLNKKLWLMPWHFVIASLNLNELSSLRVMEICNKFKLATNNKLIKEKFNNIGVTDFMILNTCYRSEVYFCCSNDDINNYNLSILDESHILYKIFLILGIKFSKQDLKALKIFYDNFSIMQGLKIASGLDSRFIGENEIIRQFKSSYKQASNNNWTSKNLNLIIQSIIAYAKNIRNKYSLSNLSVSLNNLVFKELKKVGNKNSKVIILGSGKIAKNLVNYTYSNNWHKVTILSNTKNHALQLAKSFNYNNNNLKQLPALIKDADIIISALDIEKPLIDNDYLNKHNLHNLNIRLWIDLGMPPNIDNACIKSKLLDLKYFWNKAHINNNNKLNDAINAISNEIYLYTNEIVVEIVKRMLIIDGNNYNLWKNYAYSLRDFLVKDAISDLVSGKNERLVIESLAYKLTNKILDINFINQSNIK